MIVVVLPAYNEASSLGDLFNGFCEAIEEEGKPLRFILVNDGSTDATGKVALGFKSKLDLDIITHPENKGLAEAIKTGLLRAVETSSDRDIIVTMDSDNTHLPGLIYGMARMIREGNDIIIASRYQRGSRIRGLNAYRRFLSSGASLLFKTMIPIQGVRDYTCGYRAYRAPLLKRAFKEYGKQFISESGFSCMVDILLKLRKYHPVISEIPIILRYDQKKDKSKMNVGKTIRQTLRLLFQRRFER